MNYHNITKDDMLNGSGLRVVLWLSGCSHHCTGCHNPLTWNPNDGLPFTDNEYQEICEQLEKPYISGLTLSGGDPMHVANRDEVRELISKIKNDFPDKIIWLYTGDLWENIKDDAMISNIDVIVDGEFIQSLADGRLHWKGSENQRVIDVKKTITLGNIVLYD